MPPTPYINAIRPRRRSQHGVCGLEERLLRRLSGANDEMDLIRHAARPVTFTTFRHFDPFGGEYTMPVNPPDPIHTRRATDFQ